ncbi:hypothetical protein [Paenibacillus sp. OK060]|uniref:hypothetical protein n=1 Tax=Paenibacillus sp. OK060 TaxID=1881034 RepID=UPI0015A3A5A0|nr:hypothetical protein [Paenibacillus sp. OK060]
MRRVTALGPARGSLVLKTPNLPIAYSPIQSTFRLNFQTEAGKHILAKLVV